MRTSPGRSRKPALVALPLAVSLGAAVWFARPRAKRESWNFDPVLLPETRRALRFYRADCGRYPSTAMGLRALLEPSAECPHWGPDPYLMKLPKDGRDRPLVYTGHPEDDDFTLGNADFVIDAESERALASPPPR